MESKKGAIELSMTTIIVVVLGVTLLVLGLVFIRNIFGNLESLTMEQFRVAQQQLQERMGATTRMAVFPDLVTLEPGKSAAIAIGIQNLAESESDTQQSRFRIDITPGPNSKKEWIELPLSLGVRPGEREIFKIIVTLPKSAVPGKAYAFTVTSYKGDVIWDEQNLFIQTSQEE